MTTTITAPAPTPAPVVPAAKVRRREPGSLWWLRLIPAFILIGLAIVGPYIIPKSATDVVGDSSQAPSGKFWFGTDADGLDVFSRTIAATRENVEIAVIVVLLASLGGALIGLAVGMNESRGGAAGFVARGGARLIDLVQAVPAVLIALVLVAFYGGTFKTLVIALSVILLPIQMRLVRVEVLKVRTEAYVDAARMAGMSEFELTLRTVLPNSSRAALENVSVVFALAIILTAALGFLGVGLAPPTPEWGAMIAKGATDAALGRWWAALFPTIALALSVGAVSFSFNAVLNKLRHR
jgi:peptide/nickel transport system permease protein